MQTVSISDPILWYEGMPLLPHHFQQESIRQQSLFQMQLQVLGSFQYGVLDFDIDKVELIKNVFKVNRIYAIMPDGVVVNQNNLLSNLVYNLPKPDEYEKSTLSVYLCIPKLVGDNFFLGKNPRFKREEYLDVVDINSGDDPVEVSRMIPNISLCSEIDENINFIKLKIALLKLDKGVWDLTDYVPPTLQIDINNKIYKTCAEIALSLRKKINYISELIYAKSADKQTSNISEYFFYALGIGLNLPFFEGLLTSKQNHPYELYLALCHIMGGLSLMTKSLAPPVPHVYSHEDLLNTFEKIRIEIEDTVNTVVNEKVNMIDSKKENDIYYILVPKEQTTGLYIYIGIKKRPVTTEQELMGWMNHAIICEAKDLDLSIQNRVLGFERESVDKAENIIPTRGVFLFKVTLAETLKEDIVVAFYNPDDVINYPSDLFLYVTRKKGE